VSDLGLAPKLTGTSERYAGAVLSQFSLGIKMECLHPADGAS